MDFKAILLCGVIGFIAEYFDATIGMGYGTFTTPLLLLLGLPPIYAVPAVLISETVLTVISGGFHGILGNVQREVLSPLIVCGVLGTAVGVTITIILSENEAAALIGIILMVVGFMALTNVIRRVKTGGFSKNKIRITGLVAGFSNGISGGGYGAISTTGLMISGVDASVAVGSTLLSEAIVALCGALLYYFLRPKLNLQLILALAIGGMISTPLGALTTKKMPSRKLGAIIGVVVISLGALSAYTRSEAFALGFVSIALIIIAYHLRMVGYPRLCVALGGVNLGIGVFMMVMPYLIEVRAIELNVPPPFTTVFSFILIIAGAIYILAGILNITLR